MAEAAAATPPKDPDAEKRQKENVEKLFARAAAESRGSIALGGRTLDYAVHAAFVSVAAAGMNINMNSTAMVRRAKAIGMPENITIRVPSPYKIPMVDSAILLLLAMCIGGGQGIAAIFERM